MTGLGGNWEWKHHIESEASQAALVSTHSVEEQTKTMEVRGTLTKRRPRISWIVNIRHDNNKSGLDEAGRRP